MTATYDVQYVGDAVLGPDKKRWSLHMKDLVRETGLQRQAIHFYIKEGLIPAGIKSSRNMAWYGEHHLERLKIIRRLQHERFLPLKAIKAALVESQEFEPGQQAFIREVQRHVEGPLRMPAKVESLRLSEVLARTKTTSGDMQELLDLGVIAIVETRDDVRIAASDVWALELVAELRALGFTEKAGFHVSDLAIYEEAVSEMFARETALIDERLASFKPAVAARMVQRLVPLVHTFIERYHESKIRRFFAASE